MEIEKICSNCDYFLYNHHCSLTGIPTELRQSCEMHELRYEAVKEKSPITKVFKGGAIISLVVIILKLWLFAEQAETKKTSDDMIKYAVALQKKSRAKINLLYYMPVTDSLNKKKFVGIFFTDDLNYQKYQFREVLPKYFNEIPIPNKDNKKIFVVNKLYVRVINTKVLVAEISGQIEYVGGRKYFYEDDKLKVKGKQTITKEPVEEKTHIRALPKQEKGAAKGESPPL